MDGAGQAGLEYGRDLDLELTETWNWPRPLTIRIRTTADMKL